MRLPKETDTFIQAWTTDPIDAKAAFREFSQCMGDSPQLSAQFVARPGISYSLRIMTPPRIDGRQIVALLDVIDDDPNNRWLSVCFFADMVEDPEDLGDFVPEGLEGRNAMCFNYDEKDDRMVEYIRDRLLNARDKALA